MSDVRDELDFIATKLGDGLGDGFAVLHNDKYVVVISHTHGVATIVADRDSALSHRSAMEIARTAGLLGITTNVYPFVVSDRPDRHAEITLRSTSIASDLKSALQISIEQGVKPISEYDAIRLMEYLNGKVTRRRATMEVGKGLPAITPEFKRMLITCAERALGHHKPWVAGVSIPPDYVVSEKFLLPALLMIAAEEWSAPYIASKRQGGFTYSMKRNTDCVLGHEVTGIKYASPFIILMAVTAAIKQRIEPNGKCILDPYVLRFADFIGEIAGNGNVFEAGDIDSMILASQ